MFYYGHQNYLRMLDEMEFWKRQETEHTVVIREVAPNLDEKYVTQLQEWELAFRQTEQKAVQLVETVIRSEDQINQTMMQHIMEVIGYALEQSKQFVLFLNELLAKSQVKNNTLVKVVINHIIRESEYYIGISQTIMAKR